MAIYDAAYDPADDKIRIRPNGVRLSQDEFDRAKAAGFRWAPKQELFYCVWNTAAEDVALELCGEIGDEDSTLVERAEERAERFEEYSEKRGQEAHSTREAVHKIFDGIPFGQPIICGHHSERRARKDAERIGDGMRKAINLWKTSEYWSDRAEAAKRHAKFLERDDVRARRIKKLEAELRGRERDKDKAERHLKAWSTEGLTLAQALRISGSCESWLTMPRKEGDSEKITHEPSAWSVLKEHKEQPSGLWAPRTLEEVIERAKRVYPGSIAHAQRWIDHLNNRLTYERAMLQEQGGLVADKFGLKVGGQVMHMRSHDWFTIVKINRKEGRVVSVSTNSRDWRRVVQVEEIKDYRDPTEEEVKTTKEATKAAPLCNYPDARFVTLTKAEWEKIPSSEKCQGTRSNEIPATDTHAKHRVRRALGCFMRGKLGPKLEAAKAKAQAEGRHFCDTNVTHVYHFVFIEDEKRKDPPKAGKEPAAELPKPVHDYDGALAELESRAAAREARQEKEEKAAPFRELEASLKGGVKVVSAPQLFPTPDHVARRMVELAGIRDGDRVLEPSAGTGQLIKAIFESGAKPDEIEAVEINYDLNLNLNRMFPQITRRLDDFMNFNRKEGFDRVLMNPPFSNAQDLKHILHALTMLKPGGRLVAICANGPRQQEALKPLATSWEALPNDTFAGTSVNAALLVIDKPAEAPARPKVTEHNPLARTDLCDTGALDMHVREYIGHEAAKMLQTQKATIRPHTARFESSLDSPLLRAQQGKEQAQARFGFDVDALPLFAAS